MQRGRTARCIKVLDRKSDAGGSECSQLSQSSARAEISQRRVKDSPVLRRIERAVGGKK